MNIFFYMNALSVYIMSKVQDETLENRFKFIIESKSKDNSLVFTVKELDEKNQTTFYMEIPCQNKMDFYEAINSLLIQYLNDYNWLLAPSFRADANISININEVFSILTKNGVTIYFNLEDEIDRLYCQEMYESLNKSNNVLDTKFIAIYDNEEEVYENDNFSKIYTNI